MIRTAEQRSLWEFVGKVVAEEVDRENKIGPFEVTHEDDEIPRHMDCSNYDECLSFAADRRWPSFGCRGCRKTMHGKFITEDKNL